MNDINIHLFFMNRNKQSSAAVLRDTAPVAFGGQNQWLKGIFVKAIPHPCMFVHPDRVAIKANAIRFGQQQCSCDGYPHP